MKKWLNLFLLSLSILSLSLVILDTNANVHSRDQRKYQTKVGDLSVNLKDPDFNGSMTMTVDVTKQRTVSIKNEGQVSQFIRVMALPIVADKQAVYQKVETAEVLKELNTSEWLDGRDGYFYYQDKLSGNQTTLPLFKNIKSQVEGTLSLKLKVEAITAEGETFKEAWWQNKPTTEPLLSIYNTLAEKAE